MAAVQGGNLHRAARGRRGILGRGGGSIGIIAGGIIGFQLIGETHRNLMEGAGLTGMFAGIRQCVHGVGHVAGGSGKFPVRVDAAAHVRNRLTFVMRGRCGRGSKLFQACGVGIGEIHGIGDHRAR